MMNEYEYKGYTIKKGPLGWFAKPEKEGANKERYGYSHNMETKYDVENWVDEQQTT